MKSDARTVTILTALYWAVAAIVAVTIAERWVPANGLRLTVFDSVDWQGRRVLDTLDGALSDERLGAAPLPLLQTYSAEWRGFLAVAQAGDYGFRTRSDDGSTLELDGEVVVDNSGEHAIREVTATRPLAAGLHPITVRYFQAGARYSLSVLWAPPGRPFEPIPRNALLPEATSATAVRLRGAVAPTAAAVVLAVFAVLLAGLGRLQLPLGRFDAILAGVTSWLERPTIAIAVLIVLASAARLAMFATTPAILWPDSHVFYETMREIVAGAWTNHDAYRTFVYPWFMTAFLGQHRSPEAGAIFVAAQQCVGLCSCLGFYAVGRRVFSPLVAFAGAAMLAGHGLQLFYELSILTETLFTAVLAGTLWLALRCYDRPSVVGAMTLGLGLALLVLVRPVAQWFVVCVLACGLLPHGVRRTQRLTALALVIGYALPLLAWMSVNQREYGFFGISLGRGMGLYTRVFEIDGLQPPSTADPEIRALWRTARGLRWSPNRVRDELDYNLGYSTATADAALSRFSIQTIAAHPLAFAAGSLRQWARQIAAPDTGIRVCTTGGVKVLCSGRNDAALPPFPGLAGDHGRAIGALRRVVTSYVAEWAMPMIAVAGCALLGVAALLAEAWTAPAVLITLTVVYFTAVPALSQAAQDRFRLPIDALLFMLAVHGVRAVGRWYAGVGAAAPSVRR